MAAKDFAELEGHPFGFMHCWEIMNDCPKWQDVPRHGKSRASEVNDLHSDEEVLDVSVGQPSPTPTYPGSKRPIGRDAAQGVCKKSTESTSLAASEFAESMRGLVLSKLNDGGSRHDAYLQWKREEREDQKCKDERLFKLEKKKVALKAKKLAIKEKYSEVELEKITMIKSQEEERILGMDLTKVKEPLRTFYAMKQADILEKYKR